MIGSSISHRKIVENLNLLDFRRTFATRLLNAGASIRSVQEILGHTSVKTAERYTVPDADKKSASASLLDPNRGVGGDKPVTNHHGLFVNDVFSVN